jgi:hypothetical protein
MTAAHFSKDTLEFIKLLARHRVRYLIVGGEAVIYHGYARLTGDVDFFYEASPTNAERLFAVLTDFWKGNIPGVESAKDLLAKNLILQFGVPPHRIDLVNSITGVFFAEAWTSRVEENIKVGRRECAVYFIGLDALVKNKESIRRPKDLEDLKYLKIAANRSNRKK